MVQADEYQEVRDGLYFWQAYEPAVKVDLSCCACRTAHGLVFIDPIPLAKPALAGLLDIAPPLAVLVTNGNHARAATWFRDRFSIPIHAHREAASELSFAIDGLVEEGATLLEEFTVTALPGAAPGEIALHRGNTLHLGDALVHLPPLGLSILPDKYCSDGRELRLALGKLLRFPVELLTFAHGLPVVAHARQRLSQILA